MFSLSYMMTTRNKLPALRHTLPRLLQRAGPDEEIVVVDGRSDDGSAEFLREQLARSGRPHQFLSEPDAGEAHALNKALLLCRGPLIKIITDDDAFHYGAVQECKRYLQDNPDLAAVFTEGADTDWSRSPPIVPMNFRAGFLRWRDERRPIAISCLGMILRRSFLPLLGLFHTGVIPVDHEYSLRLSSVPAELALYTGVSYVRILNPRSNSVTHYQKVEEQVRRIRDFYEGPRRRGLLQQARRAARARLFPVAGPIAARVRQVLRRPSAQPGAMPCPFDEALALCEAWLEEENRGRRCEFLRRHPAPAAAELGT